MKKRIFSIILMLTLALSVIIGTVIVGGAQEQPQDGVALVLEDSITAHIQMTNCPGAQYATVSLRESADDGAKLLRTVGDVSYTSKDGSTVIFSVELAVKEISSTIVVEAKDASGAVIRTYKPSVLNFLNSITGDSSASAGVKATAAALKTYGALAKTYFSGQSATPAGNVSFGASPVTKSGSVSGVSHIGSSLVLVSETTLRHYFSLDQGADIGSYTFYVDYDMDGGYDEVCDYGYHETERLEPVQSGSYYYVDITGIAPNDLDRQYAVCVTNGNETYSCAFSAMNYAEAAYGNSSSTPALKALLESLKGYLDGAAEMSANIVYKDGSTTLKTVAYQYGVDNYLDYTPAKSGYTFAGWYADAALTEKASVIEAGTTEDITLYAKFVKYNFLISDPQALNTTIQSSSSGIDFSVNSDGTVTYSDLSGNSSSSGDIRIPIDKTNGSNMLNTLINLEGHSKLFKITLEVGKEPGEYLLPFAMNGGYGWYICIPGVPDPLDGKYYVYMNSQSENQKLAVLPEDGSLATVTVYIDFSRVDVNNYADSVNCVDLYAVNMAGKVITATISTREYNAWCGDKFGRAYIGNQLNSITSAFVSGNHPAAIKIGNFLMEAVDADKTPFSNYIIDSYGNKVMEYTPFKATRLPETYSLADNATLKFAGWYADVECTKPINSIPAGSSGILKVYPKWTPADVTASDAELAESVRSLLSAFAGKSYGSLPTFSTSYNNIPALTQSHPRVYVNSATLENVITNFTCDDNERVYSAILYEADRGLKETSVEIQDSITYAESLALSYLITGKEAYGYKAIYYVLNYIDQMTSVTSYNGYDASSALHVFGEVYDWCYALLTSEQKTQIINGACNYVAKYSEAGVPPSNKETVVGHGTEQLFMRDWVAFAIAVADEAPSIYNYVAGRLVNEYVKAPNWYYQSGVQGQGSAYGTVARLYPNIAADMMMYAATGERIFTVDLANVILTHINRVRPDGESIRIGDDFNQVGSYYAMTQLAKIAFYAGDYYGNTTAKAWYEELGSWFDADTGELSKAMFIITSNPAVKADATPYENLELVHTTKYPSSSVVARSAWDDPSAWLTYTNIEEAGTNNHDHKDSGTFQIYYKGILAPDTGMYEYNGTDYNALFRSRYAIQTISKNGLLIYNPSLYAYHENYLYTGGQRGEEQADFVGSYTLDAFLTTNNANRATLLGEDNGLNADGSFKYAYISGDITKAYNDKTVDLVMRSTMTIATNDPEHPMAFIVYDRITSDSASYKKTFLLHTMEKPTFNGGTESAGEDSFTNVTGATSFYYTNTLGPSGAYEQDDLNDKYNGKLTAQTLLPENPTYRYIGGDGYRFWLPTTKTSATSTLEAHNAITENNTRHPVGEVGWGRVEISPSTQNKTDSFLNVMYVGDAKDAAGNETSNTLIPSTLVQCDTHEGAVSFGSVVMFSKTNTAVSGTVEFTASGSGEMTYYVTGLASGSWIIKVDGVAIDDYLVEAGSGLLSFKADAGKRITLTKGSIQTYDISYETNGGIINDSSYTTEFAAGDTVTLPVNVTKSGCRFDGWYTDASFTTAANAQTISTSGANVTLYAKFTPAVYISYQTNGGTIADSTYTSQFYPGDAVTLPVNVTKSGCRFDGWYTNAGFTTAANAQTISASGVNVTLYAKFTPAVYISYQTNGGTIADSTYTSQFYPGDAVTLPVNVTKSGHKFGGWYTDEGLTTAANAQTVAAQTGTVTLYAKFISAYTITYQTNGGTINDSSYTTLFFAGESITLPSNLTMAGYMFAGWYTDAGLTTPANASSITASVTLYAKWERVGGSIIYMVDGTAANTTAFDGTSDVYLGYTPDPRVSYAFAGWYADSACTVKASPVIPAGTNEDVTVYAKWESFEALDLSYLFNGRYIQLQKQIIYSNTPWGGSSFNTTPSETELYRSSNSYGTSLTVYNPNRITSSVDNSRHQFAINTASGGGVVLSNYLGSGNASGTNVFRMTLELGKVKDQNVLPFVLGTGGWDATLDTKGDYGIDSNVVFTTGKDNYVYFGQVDEAHKIGVLEDGKLTSISIDCDYSTTLDDNYVTYTATNLDGETVTERYYSGVGAANDKGIIFYMLIGMQTEGAYGDASIFEVQAKSALSLGMFHFEAVPQPISKIVDPDGNLVMNYELFEAATLPETYGDGSRAFLGWYADAELTQPITGISKGNSGIVTVYPKFINSTNLVYMVDGQIVKQVACTPDAETPIDFIPTPAPGYLFEGWYTDEAFTTEASASVPAGSTGNTIVYAKFGNYDVFCGSKSDYFQIGVGKTASNTTKNSDGTVTYIGVSGGAQVLGPDWRSMTNETLPTINGTKITTYKFSLEIARVANTPVAGFALNGVYAGTYFEVTAAGADETAYVKMAGGTTGSTNVTIAELPADGSVVTIDFYLSFEGFDFDGANQRVHGYAYNTDGELVEGGTWGATLHAGEYYMFKITPNAANTSDSAITIGEFHATPVNADFSDIAQVISVG